MEDCLDDFMARLDHEGGGHTGLKGFFDKLKKLKPSHEIAVEIEKLKARAIEASKRHKRYKNDFPIPNSITSEIDPRLHALYVDVGKIVGMDDPKKHIIERLENEDVSTPLQVVSIVGTGGLGKTTLANAVYQAIKGEFSCSALVSVSRKPNMKNVLRDISERVGISHSTSNDDERRLIDRLRDHLQNEKYLIVIDDIWSTEAWETIRDALLNNDHGSGIITTTHKITELPSKIGDLQYLETLDIRGAKNVGRLPSTITRLQRLTRLYVNYIRLSEPLESCTDLSDGVIGQLQSLEDLESVLVFPSQIKMYLQELDQLTNLRTLNVIMLYPPHFCHADGSDDVERFVGTLISSYNLHHLRVDYMCEYGTLGLLSLESWCPATPSVLREISITNYHIDKVPNWMISLVNLRALDISLYRMGPEDVEILGAMPALFFL
ncbi:hypothetical protein CFC21_013238 [Triticum aestivum]|uniref:Uncharacterized protein n=2 Tax=Triticum aestivum TaxID=4565 RepID=A0A3B5ZZ17_WHEAT|nr:hypothetical protein CFC21_013238 [Triticum aestivum]